MGSAHPLAPPQCKVLAEVHKKRSLQDSWLAPVQRMFKQVSLPLNSSLSNTDWHGQRLVPSLCVSTADQVTSSWDSEAEDCCYATSHRPLSWPTSASQPAILALQHLQSKYLSENLLTVPMAPGQSETAAQHADDDQQHQPAAPPPWQILGRSVLSPCCTVWSKRSVLQTAWRMLQEQRSWQGTVHPLRRRPAGAQAGQYLLAEQSGQGTGQEGHWVDASPSRQAQHLSVQGLLDNQQAPAGKLFMALACHSLSLPHGYGHKPVAVQAGRMPDPHRQAHQLTVQAYTACACSQAGRVQVPSLCVRSLTACPGVACTNSFS